MRERSEKEFLAHSQAAHLAVKSLALIGDTSAHEAGAKPHSPGRGIFDKETRRKPLAFVADAVGYGISMPFWYFEVGSTML